jgi:hypothetical protein
VPVRLPDALFRGPLIEGSSDAVLVRVPMVGRFLVRAEGPTLVERATGATDADLRCFRDEVVAAVAALLRGTLVLRAASVSIAGRAVSVCGPSAAGKSALAAALAQRGHAVLADAVSVVSHEPDDERPAVASRAPEPVLWPDTVEELGLSGSPARRLRPALPKYAYRLGPARELPPTPLAAVVVLSPEPSRTEPEVEPLVGATKLRTLLAARWHQRLVDPLGHSAAQFTILTRIAAATPCVRLVRPSRGAPAALLAQLVEELVE